MRVWNRVSRSLRKSNTASGDSAGRSKPSDGLPLETTPTQGTSTGGERLGTGSADFASASETHAAEQDSGRIGDESSNESPTGVQPYKWRTVLEDSHERQLAVACYWWASDPRNVPKPTEQLPEQFRSESAFGNRERREIIDNWGTLNDDMPRSAKIASYMHLRERSQFLEVTAPEVLVASRNRHPST